jgi:alkylation response protein AidB-like acyl-CoA dehydrogenase
VSDSNCREGQPRKTAWRPQPQWNYSGSEPVSENYFPTGCLVRASSAALTLAVAVDRAQGSTSPGPGALEVMVHRRMAHDDGRGVGEALNVRVPAANIIGGVPGQGFKTAMKVLDHGRIEVAAMATGIASTALKLAQDWCKTRIIGGEALSTRQGIRWQLADMATDLAAARAGPSRAGAGAPRPARRGEGGARSDPACWRTASTGARGRPRLW